MQRLWPFPHSPVLLASSLSDKEVEGAMRVIPREQWPTALASLVIPRQCRIDQFARRPGVRLVQAPRSSNGVADTRQLSAILHCLP